MFIEKLGPHNIQTYPEMVQRPQLVEDTMANVEGIRGKDISKPTFIKRGAVDTTGTFPNNNNNNNKRPTTGKDYVMEKKIKVAGTMIVEYCKFCNKPGHQADKFWKKVGACLRCGSHEHRISNCPMLKDQVGRNQGVVKLQGRVNAITQAELPEGGTSSITCWGRVEELLVAGEQEIKHTKLIFFSCPSASTCVNRPLGVDQSGLNKGFLKNDPSSTQKVSVLKRYPAMLSVTTFTCLFGLPQFLAIVAFTQTEAEWWKVHIGGELFTILYTGLVASGFAFSLQFWCIGRGWPMLVVV
ncbi:hypothetical protein Taro_008694 [Colocasia esculenta]|uniref:Uncharacterized protein n=1 Tax=Colocasia esculenta TaxID=4460 RepID=A0A843U3R2_COLES|nr:hypothetical protein [Colocasia esculenta]